MSAKSLVLNHVAKQYVDDKKNTVRAVEDFNLTINPGEFATFLGPSGCGKTTILRMIAGFEELTSGDIYFGDQNVKHMPANKRDCAMVFQSYALFPHMSVMENISYGLRLKKLSTAEIEKKVAPVMDIMNLGSYGSRMPGQLSGGQQQRVALARALVMEPGVLLFDEPLSNLDAKLRITMRDEIRRVQQEAGITAIYVTHDQSEAMSLSDKIIVMNGGRIEQIGSPQDIYQRPQSKFVADFIGAANFLQGRVDRTDGSAVYVAVKNTVLAIPHAQPGAFQPQQHVHVVVRPEAIHVVKEGENRARVLKSVFTGRVQEYELDYEGDALNALTFNPVGSSIFHAGDDVAVEFDVSSLYVVAG